MTVGTFFENYNLSGKYIYPVSQSTSMDTTQYEQSVEFIKECAKGAIVDDGIFSKDNALISSYITDMVMQPAEAENPSSASNITSYADVPLLALNAAKGEYLDYQAVCAKYEKIYGEKAADSISIKDRLRQKEQIVKEREMIKVHQVRQKDRGVR